MAKLSETIVEAILTGLLPLWPLFLLLILVGLAIHWIARLFDLKFKAKGQIQYVSRQTLLTPAERIFHESLHAAVGHQYWICPKVRLSDIVNPDPVLNLSSHQISLNKINQKHVDFVLCNPGDFTIVAVIELDDSTHRQKNRQARDTQVDSILAECEIPILHVPCAKTYSPETLSTDLNRLLIPAGS